MQGSGPLEGEASKVEFVLRGAFVGHTDCLAMDAVDASDQEVVDQYHFSGHCLGTSELVAFLLCS